MGAMLVPGLTAGHFEDCPVHKIAAADKNKFVLLCDGKTLPFVSVIEIFDKDGKTPPNTHADAHEYFYVLAGEGIAAVDGKSIPIKPGSYFVVDPGHVHEVHNTGEGRLYVLTTMVPDEKFSDLILAGPKASLDEEDLRVLRGV